MLPAITIWMNMPSFYQADLFRSLVRVHNADLQVIFARDLPPDRERLGWKRDLSGYPSYFLNTRCPLQDALRLAWAQKRRFHVVNGLWGEPAFALALAGLALVDSPFAVYSEAPNPTARRSLRKQVLQIAFGRAIVARAKGLLPVSHLATDHFKRLGAKKSIVYPFGYFRSTIPATVSRNEPRHSNRTEVIFVGQLVPRKGADILLEAIAPLFGCWPGLVLSIVGYGAAADSLRKQAHDLGVGDRVHIEGVIPSDELPGRLAAADVLVLPSRWDGWGLVVNEALMMGVPVIISDRCGAADLIEHGRNGYVFTGENIADLQSCLVAFLSRRAEWPGMRANAAETGARISADVAAGYLWQCVNHMTDRVADRPTAPWLN